MERGDLMKMRRALIAVAFVGIGLLCAPLAIAGKGGDKGKPGGGGGGSDPTPSERVLYRVRVGKGQSLDRKLFSIPVAGGDEVAESDPIGSAGGGQCAWSPGGGSIAYLVNTTSNYDSELRLVDRASGLVTAVQVPQRIMTGPLSWTCRREAGEFLDFTDQFLLMHASGNAVEVCDETYTRRNLYLVSGDPGLVSPSLTPLTNFKWTPSGDGWTAGTAHSATWLGERAELPDRAWVVFQHVQNTAMPPAGEAFCDNPNLVHTEERQWRVLPLDTSRWPAVTVIPGYESGVALLDSTGAPFAGVPAVSKPLQDSVIPMSRNATRAAWVDDQGRLAISDLELVSASGAAGAPLVPQVDVSTLQVVNPPSGFSLKGTNYVVLNAEGTFVALYADATTSGGSQTSVWTYSVAGGTWTEVSRGKIRPEHFALCIGPVVD
jgi:hypothetical protein